MTRAPTRFELRYRLDGRGKDGGSMYTPEPTGPEKMELVDGEEKTVIRVMELAREGWVMVKIRSLDPEDRRNRKVDV